MRFEFWVSGSSQLNSFQKLDSKHLTEWTCKQGWENWAHHSNCNNQNQKKPPFINFAVQSPHCSLPKSTNSSVPPGPILILQILLSSMLSFPKEKVPQGGMASRSGEFSSGGYIRASFLLYIFWLRAKKYSFVKQLPNIYLEHTKTSSNQIKWTESCCAVCTFSS